MSPSILVYETRGPTYEPVKILGAWFQVPVETPLLIQEIQKAVVFHIIDFDEIFRDF